MGLCYAEPMVTVFNGDTRSFCRWPGLGKLARRIVDGAYVVEGQEPGTPLETVDIGFRDGIFSAPV